MQSELSQMIDSISNPMWLVEFTIKNKEYNFKYIAINKAFTDVTGVAMGNAQSLDLKEVFAEPNFKLIHDKYKEVVTKAIQILYVEELIFGGVLMYFKTTLTPIFDTNGTLVRFSGIAIDITNQIKAENEIEEAKSFLEETLNSIKDPIFVKDDNSRLVNVNSAFCDLFAMKKEDVLGKTLAEHVAENEREHFLKVDTEVIKTGQSSVVEETLTLSNQPPLTIRTKKSRFTSSSGKHFLIGSINDVTSYKNIERELKIEKQKLEQNEARLSQIYNNTLDPIWVIKIEKVNNEINFRFESINDAFIKITGFKVEEVVGKLIENVLPKSSHALVRGKYMEALTTKKTIIYEEIAPLPNGTKYADISVVPLVENGEIVRLLGIAHDKTEAYLAEQKIITSENQLVKAQEIAKIGSWEFDLVNFNLHWSKEHYRIFEIPLETKKEQLYEAYRSKIHPDDIEELDKQINEAIKNGTNINYHHRVLLPNNKIKYVLGLGEVEKDSNGNSISARGTVQDITERKIQEDALLESQLQYENLFENARDGIFIIDFATMKIVQINNAAANNLGYTKSELINSNVSILYDNKTAELMRSGFAKMESSTFALIESKHKKKDGSYMDVEISSTKMVLNNNVVIQAIVRDSTLRKQNEAILAKSESVYRGLFENSETSIWEEDCSEMFASIMNLKATGIKDIKLYLKSNPSMVMDYASTVKVLRVNPATVKLFGVENTSEFLKNIRNHFGHDAFDVFSKLICSIFEGNSNFKSISHYINSSGEEFPAIISLKLPQTIEEAKSVIISIVNISDNLIKKALKDLDEKEILLKEIHHRVKNNLQIISSLISLTAKKHEEKLKNSLLEVNSRILTMSIVHEQLYSSGNLASINTAKYINQLATQIKNLYSSLQKINIIIEIEEIDLDLDKAIPLGLIINEIITNSFKYAFDENEGEVKISLFKTKDKFTLMVSDNGKGIESQKVLDNSKSLGYKLICSLTKQLRGELSIDLTKSVSYKIVF